MSAGATGGDLGIGRRVELAIHDFRREAFAEQQAASALPPMIALNACRQRARPWR